MCSHIWELERVQASRSWYGDVPESLGARSYKVRYSVIAEHGMSIAPEHFNSSATIFASIFR